MLNLVGFKLTYYWVSKALEPFFPTEKLCWYDSIMPEDGTQVSKSLKHTLKMLFSNTLGICHTCTQLPNPVPRSWPTGVLQSPILYLLHQPSGLRKLLQCKAQMLLVPVHRVQTGTAAELTGHALWNPLCPELYCILQLVPASEQQGKHVLSSITGTLNTSTINLGRASTLSSLHKLSLAADSCTSLINSWCTPSSLRCPVLGKAMALAAGSTQRSSLKINREQAAWFS